MSKYTINQFRKDFPDDDVCLDKLFSLKYGKLECCPNCNKKANFKRIITRKCYQCKSCYYQLYPCADTVFEKTRTPLLLWFYTIYLFTTSKNGLSAYELQRQIGVTYKTAWRMLKQIRILLSQQEVNLFEGTVEMDETFVGGKNKNRHKDKKVKNNQGRSFKDKTPVFGILQRNGNVRAIVVTDTTGATLKPLIYNYVKIGSNIMTDEWKAYQGLYRHYNHSFVEHCKGSYSIDNVTTNRIENFWSVLKRTLNGSYISVSKKYLQLYVNEVAFRYNNRNSKNPIFYDVLALLQSS